MHAAVFQVRVSMVMESESVSMVFCGGSHTVSRIPSFWYSLFHAFPCPIIKAALVFYCMASTAALPYVSSRASLKPKWIPRPPPPRSPASQPASFFSSQQPFSGFPPSPSTTTTTVYLSSQYVLLLEVPDNGQILGGVYALVSGPMAHANKAWAWGAWACVLQPLPLPSSLGHSPPPGRHRHAPVRVRHAGGRLPAQQLGCRRSGSEPLCSPLPPCPCLAVSQRKVCVCVEVL